MKKLNMRDSIAVARKAVMMWQKLEEHFFGEGRPELDYSEFCDLGVEVGLLERVLYDPKKHGEIEDAAPGDPVFVPAKP